MTDMTTATRMMQRFSGYDKAYGTYDNTKKNINKGGKLEIKSSARTVKSPVTYELWEEHLSGERSLGIIPVNEHGRVMWACIDYDRYDIDHGELVKKVEAEGLPLIVCKTKSNGAHLYAFFKGWVDAEDAIDAMRGLSAVLGLGNCEIFPKQSQVLYERGDSGSWLNMPYFGDTRFAVKRTGLGYTLSEFLIEAKRLECTLQQLQTHKRVVPEPKSGDIMDGGPPCLQFLTSTGIKEGHRNKTLTALAIFAKKKYDTNWENKLVEINGLYFDPPLDNEEVQGVIKSVSRKDYNYACKDTPLCDHCISSVCIGRTYGVGDANEFPRISGISVLMSDEPTFFVDVQGARVCIPKMEDLITYRKFQTVVAKATLRVPAPLKDATWNIMLNDALREATVIMQPEDVTSVGVFKEYFQEFLEDMVSDQKSGLHRGRVWHNPETDEFWFKLAALEAFLTRRSFKFESRKDLSRWLRDVQARYLDVVSIDAKKVRLWAAPNTLDKAEPLELPETEESVL